MPDLGDALDAYLNPPDPEAVRVLKTFQAKLSARDKKTMQVMANKWMLMERRLAPEFHSVALEIADGYSNPTTTMLWKNTRYQKLLAEIHTQVRKYEKYADEHIRAEQVYAWKIGENAAIEMIKKTTQKGIDFTFNHLPVNAVNNIIGLCQDNAPLFSLLNNRALWPGAVANIEHTLLYGTAMGFNPRKVAKMMAEYFTGGLHKALTIARTEQMRAFRTASLETFRENKHIVGAWVWYSAADMRTCPACWALHGTYHPLEETLNDHVNGRCAMLPATRSYSSVAQVASYSAIDELNQVPEGEKLFKKLSATQQEKILGRARYAWYKAGTPLNDMVKITNDPVWGKTIGLRPVPPRIKALVSKRSNATKQAGIGKTGENKNIQLLDKNLPRMLTDKQNQIIEELSVKSNQWARNLPEDEHNAVYDWSGSDYKTMRIKIASGDIGPKEEAFLRAVEKAPQYEGIAWRGIGTSKVGFVSDYTTRIGQVIQWDEPSSATIDPNVQFGDVTFEIITKQSAFIRGASAMKGEQEIILMPGSQFKVLDVFDATFDNGWGYIVTRPVVQLEQILP